jgi:hypothetical protein
MVTSLARSHVWDGAAMELKLDCGHLSDDEFVAAFEALQLKHAHFNHGDRGSGRKIAGGHSADG